ncbi:protein huluwa-like [Tiliqua scincoides]|uniref:protein huluwa-like n=1 Tax=Tiliqua scincoides TaxID=71010 RepID=UPI003461D404
MEPLGGLEALQGTLRLLVGLLVLCLALLFLLNGLSVLRWRPAWPRGSGKAPGQAPPTSPPLLQVLPSGAVARHGQPLWTPAARLLTSPRPGGAAGLRGWREPLGPRPPLCSQGTASSASDLNKHPVLVPPNSPVTTTGSRGVPGRGFSSCHTSTQSKLRSCSRTVWPSHVHLAPFEYGSSIQRNEERTGLNSANFTASQGPGLDSNFGASAGISVRILSSDSEESPSAAQPHPQQLGQFEWDYYDPGYKQRTRLPQQLPQICSKQYWL